MFRASPYKLEMFLECPAKYKFCYIDGLGKKFETPKPYFTMGENVHAALKEFFKLNPKERNYEKLEALLRQIWKNNRKGFKTEEEERKYGKDSLVMLLNFCQKQDLKSKPLFLEEVHEINIGSDLSIMGRIDRIDEEKDKSLHIIDYKTGKEWEKEENLQFIIYPLVVSRKFNKKVNRVSYLYLTNNKLKTIHPKEKDLKKGIERIKHNVANLALFFLFRRNNTSPKRAKTLFPSIYPIPIIPANIVAV